MSSTTIIPREAAISMARRRARLMRQADAAVRAGNAAEAQSLDKTAHQCELFLHAHGHADLL